MMRVLHLVSEKTWRGGEQQVAYLVAELQRHQVESFVACPRGSAFEAHCRQHHIPYLALSFSKLRLLGDALKLKAYIDRHRIQLVHMHSSLAHTLGVLAHTLGARADLVLSRRVEFSIGRNPFSTFKYNYSGIKRIICVSESVRRQLAASIQDGSKCVTIYSGIDLKKATLEASRKEDFLRSTYHIPQDLKLIGNVSALDRHKDYFTFLETAKILKESGVKAKYFAIGSGPLEAEIKEYAERLGLRDDVVFTGFLKNAKAVLAELEVFLFTTLKEGIGSTVLDAFASKVPVVSTSAGGVPEIVRHGHTGLLAPLRDATALAAHVQQVLRDAQLREHLVEQAYQLVLTFTQERTAIKTLAVYQEIIELR